MKTEQEIEAELHVVALEIKQVAAKLGELSDKEHNLKIEAFKIKTGFEIGDDVFGLTETKATTAWVKSRNL